ncbi:MAG: MATE family efflux transporter [Verrucomicrobiota bacterium]
MLKTAGPLIATQYSVTLIHVVDALIAGRLGEVSLAALGPASMMILVLVTFGLGVMGAVSAFLGQAFGAGRNEDCGKFAWQGIWMGLAFGLACLTLIPTAPVLFGQFFNSAPEVFPLQVDYFRISIYAVGLEMAVDAMAMFAVATRRPWLPLISAAVAVGINALASLSLSFGWLGLAPMGLSGIAWGTVIGIGAQFLYFLLFFLNATNRNQYGTLQAVPSSVSLRKMAAIGLPSGFQEALDLASWGVVILWLVGFFGVEHVAATTVVLRCMQLSYMPADGLGIALSMHVAKSVGAQKFRQAQRGVRETFKGLSLYSLFTALLFFIFREPIMGLFTSDPQIIEIGSRCLLVLALIQWFDAMTVVFVNALQGVGDTVWPAIANLVLTLVVLVLGGRLVVQFSPGSGSVGVWLVAGVYLALQGLVFWGRWRSGRWKMLELLEN